jgi:hypothetical protein
MFDKIGDAAEKLATNVSRRAFLGRLGQGALGLAAVIGGVLAVPGEAHAAGQWCEFDTYNGCWFYKAVRGNTCPCGGYLVNYKPRCRLFAC